MEPTVRDVPEAKRYEIRDGEQLLGHNDYERRGDTLLFTHTEVDQDSGRSGVGSTLLRAALDDVRAKVAPSSRCARSCAAGSNGTTTTPTWSQHLGTEPAGGACGQSTCWPYISPSGSAISSMRAPSGSRK